MKIKKITLNILAILLMLSGPFLMILPGPQVLSWLGLGLFLWINKDYFQKFNWYNKLENKIKNKLPRKYSTFKIPV